MSHDTAAMHMERYRLQLSEHNALWQSGVQIARLWGVVKCPTTNRLNGREEVSAVGVAVSLIAVREHRDVVDWVEAHQESYWNTNTHDAPNDQLVLVPSGITLCHPGLKLNTPPSLFRMSWCPDFEFRGARCDVGRCVGVHQGGVPAICLLTNPSRRFGPKE